jgi:hypothetical protein
MGPGLVTGNDAEYGKLVSPLRAQYASARLGVSTKVTSTVGTKSGMQQRRSP